VSTTALNYESPQSQETIKKILAFLLGRPLHGATQQQIADMLECSLQTSNRFVQHLLMKGQIHIAIKAQAMYRNSPAVYKHGPRYETVFPPNARYQDLPLNFFGGVERRKVKRTMNMNEVPALKPDIMTDWINFCDGSPARNGAYLCRVIIGGEPQGEHKRWFNGVTWSHPLQDEHERADGFKKPRDNQFVEPELLPSLEWRGFKEDQEPL